MKKIFYFVIPLLLVANVAFAEWYNPLTWFNKPLGDTLSPMPMFYQSGTSILPRVRNLNLILDRGITVGDSTSTATGTIRYNSGSFEGYDGSNWGSLGGGSADALTTSTVFAGDISGTSSSLMIDKIRGRNVTTTQTPSIGYILKWDGTYWNYKPDDTGAGGGITNLNGQTGGTQSFASTTGGTAFYVISSADTHTFNFPATPIFTGVSTTYATTTVLRANGTTTLNGNQMPTTTCALGDVFVGYASGVIQCRATSTLGLQSTLTTGNLTAGTGLSFDNTRQVIGGAAQISVAAGYNLITDASSTEFASSSNRVIKNAGKWDTAYSYAHATATESVAGLEFSGQDLQLTTGYVIPLSASTTNWNTAYNTVNSSSTYWDTAYNRVNGTLSDGKYCTYASATGKISCNSTPSTGITSLAGQTGATQLFATGTKPTGLDFKIVSSGDTHTFTLSVDGTYAIPLSASTTNWNTAYNTVNSSSSNWDIAYVKGVSAYGQAHATATESITGIDLTGQNFSLTSGYNIPTDASTTAWNNTTVYVNASSTAWNQAHNRVYNGTYTDGKYCTYASATGKISCTSEGGTAGISSLAGQTGATQTISTTTGTGLSFKVVSSANNHDFQASIASGYNLVTDASSTEFASSSNKVIKTAPNWDTAYSVINSSSSNWDIAHNRTTKGTLTATKLCTWNAGGYFDCNTDPSASSGFTTTSINNFATTTFSFATGTATGIGLTITTSTSAVTFTPTVSSGYGIPLTASSTEWANAYNRIYGGTMTDAKYCTYASATGKISCNSEGGAGGGFTTTTFKTAYQSYATTTLNFATSSDTNLGIAVLVDTTGITLTPQWIGTLEDARITSATKWNQLDTASSTWTDAYTKRVDTWTYPLQLSSNVASIASNYFLTTSTEFGGDVSGTSSAITVADNSHNHDSTTISNLDASNDFNAGILATTYGGIGTSTIKTNGIFFGYSTSRFGQDDRFTYNTSTDLLTVGNGSSTNWTATNIWGTKLTYTNASTTNLTVGTNSYLGTVKSGTWNGSAIDISSYTNLTASNGIQLNGDNIEPATNYSIPLTASSTNWNNSYDIVNASSSNWDIAYVKGLSAYSQAHATATESILGIDLTGQAFSLTSGYEIPTTTRMLTWDTAYNTVNASSSKWDEAYVKGLNAYSFAHATATESITGIDLIGQAFSLTSGYIIPTIASTTNYDIAHNRVNGTMTDTKYCTYASATGKISCNSEGGSSGGGTTVFVTTTPSLILPTSTLATYDFALGSTATATAPFWWDVSATTTYIGTAGAGDGAIDFTHNGTQAMSLGYDYSTGKFTIATSTDFSAGIAMTINTSTLAIGLGGFMGSNTECDYGTSTSATTTIDFASTTKPCFSNMARVEIATTTSVLSIVNPPLNGNLDIRIFQGSSVTTTLSFASNIAFEGGFLPSLPYGTSTESLLSCKYRTTAGNNSTKNFKCQLSKDWK